MKHPTALLYRCEAEVTPGLEFVSEAELRELGADDFDTQPGEIDFHFVGDLRDLLTLKTVQAVSLVQPFDVPRPRALLSNAYLPLILRQIEIVRSLFAPDAFRTFVIAAAGSDTTVMQRIKTAIADQTALLPADDKGDLWLRIRPARGGGWETLARLSPRPLVTRAWRVCNLEGALNAATAHALIRLTRPQPDDVFLNLGCGSGTLLIERLAFGRCRLAIGLDNQAAHLECTLANLKGARQTDVHLWQADMAHLPLANSSVSALAADLPFGQLSGTHHNNQRLYPLVLAEAARIARSGARFALITHEVRLMDGLLAASEDWALEQAIRVNLRGLHPRIYVLLRRASAT